MKIEYSPIGVVHSPFCQKEGTPIQPSRAKGAVGQVEVFQAFADCLSDLEGFSHVILICHLHLSSGFQSKVVPFLDTQRRGLFATRAPNRPNPIGLSIVDLIEVDGNILKIKNVDLIDGTPVLDIKPYVDEFDRRKDVRVGWLEDAKARRARADNRFD